MRLSVFAASMAVLSFAAGAAIADPAPASPPASDDAVVAQGVIGADYGYVGYNQGLGHADAYGGEAGGVAPFSSDFSGQVTGGYHRVDTDGYGADDWNVAGTVSWDKPWGRLGANVGYDSASLLGAAVRLTNYGVYAEYYAAPQLTLGLRGGGVTASAGGFGVGGSENGGYVGVEGIGYLSPDVAVTGTVGYVGIDQGHQTTAGVHGEWLISESTPFSAWIGYDYESLGVDGADISGNTLSIGVKYYLGGSGSLRHRQRTGEDDWGPSVLDLIR